MIRFFISSAFAFFMITVPFTVKAELLDRGGGLIYDTDLNITWLQDANYAQTSGYDNDGWMTWGEAMSWASNLSYQGYEDWRLPDSDSCGYGFGRYGCSGSEMGHMYYTTLGREAGTQSGASGPFSNLINWSYWSRTEYETTAWAFWYSDGYQKNVNKGADTLYAWAVRDGDSAPLSVVPEPVGATLFLVGVATLGFRQRRKRKST